MNDKPDWQAQERSITRHQVGDINSQVGIAAEPDSHAPGGGCHRYRVELRSKVDDGKVPEILDIRFHEGAKEPTPNGVTDEALLCILIDRLERFQRGELSSRHNVLALTKLEEALLWLQERTRDRQQRGVEGKHVP